MKSLLLIEGRGGLHRNPLLGKQHGHDVFPLEGQDRLVVSSYQAPALQRFVR
jgi:hypothetical protein